jgi:hypothetical protein
MTTAETRAGVAIADEDYNKIVDLLKDRKTITLTNKDNIKKTFYFKGKDLFAHSVGKDKKLIVEEVFKVSDVMRQQQMADENSFLNVTRRKIRQTYPEWTDEQVEAEADIVNEGNETIKRLMKGGLKWDMALAIVKNTLMSKDIEKDLDQIASLLANNEES